MTGESATYENETSRNSMEHFEAMMSFASGLSCTDQRDFESVACIVSRMLKMHLEVPDNR